MKRINDWGKVHSVKYNFVMNFILTATNFIFPLITFPYVARVLLPAGNGKVSFVASIANYFVMVASLGIPTYGVRACAIVRDDKDKLSKTVHEIFCINLITTLFVFLTYLICILAVPKFAEERTLFYINGINILLNMFGMNWVFQALEQYDYITFRSIVFKLISIIFMFLLVHSPKDYVIYGAISVFAAVGSYAFNFVRLTRIINLKRYSDYNLKQHLSPIFVLFAQSLAVSIYTNLDTVMLGFMKTDTDVGYYNAAVKIKHILLSLVTALGNVLLPRMSYYYKKNMIEEFKDTMVKALNFTVMLSVPLVTFFIVFAKEGMTFVAGDEYIGAVLAMQLITIAVIPNGLTGVLGVQVLTPMEKERYVLYSVVGGAIIDFLLNLVMIPSMGAAGASLATTIAEFLVLIIQAYYLHDLLFQLVKKLRYHLYFGAATICILGALLMREIPFPSAFLSLIVNSIIFFGIYGLLLLINKEPIILQVIEDLKKKIRNP